MSKGHLITLEGGEGAGKSTQARRLASRLEALGRPVVLTREPGGSAGAEAIRELLVTGATDRWSPITETLLMNAARRDHLERTVTPALEAGAWVVCDRFADSTRAYQGAGGGASDDFLRALEGFVLEGVRPSLTLILDLPIEIGLARVAQRNAAVTRFEAQDEDFHRRLRAAFLAIAQAEPDRCVVVDASADPDGVEAAIWAATQRKLDPGHG